GPGPQPPASSLSWRASMTDAPADPPDSAPAPAPAEPVPAPAVPPKRRGPLRSVALWMLFGGLTGVVAGGTLGTVIGMKVSRPGQSITLALALNQALALGIIGAVFAAAGAVVDELLKARRERL